MGNGKRTAEALERRAIKKAQRVAIKNEIAKEQIVEVSWICPNMDCKNDNYQRRMECNMCQTPNPNPVVKQVRVKKPKPQKKVVSEGEGGEKKEKKKKRPSPKERKALWLAKQAAEGGVTTGGVDKPEEKWKTDRE